MSPAKVRRIRLIDRREGGRKRESGRGRSCALGIEWDLSCLSPFFIFKTRATPLYHHSNSSSAAYLNLWMPQLLTESRWTDKKTDLGEDGGQRLFWDILGRFNLKCTAGRGNWVSLETKYVTNFEDTLLWVCPSLSPLLGWRPGNGSFSYYIAKAILFGSFDGKELLIQLHSTRSG